MKFYFSRLLNFEVNTTEIVLDSLMESMEYIVAPWILLNWTFNNLPLNLQCVEPFYVTLLIHKIQEAQLQGFYMLSQSDREANRRIKFSSHGPNSNMITWRLGTNCSGFMETSSP